MNNSIVMGFVAYLTILIIGYGCPAPVAIAAMERTAVVELSVGEWNQGLSASDRQEKYCRMAANPFTFYRGSNHLFWSDFANDPRLALFSSPQTQTWLQGDLHTQNHGSFQDDRGEIIYDLNDFDEAVIADYQYDLWRMATSLLLMVRNDEQVNFDPEQEAVIVNGFSRGYWEAMADYAIGDSEITQVFTAQNTSGRLDEFLKTVAADSKRRRKMLKKWTNRRGKQREFDTRLETLASVSPRIKAEILAAWPDYLADLAGKWSTKERYFTVKAIAQRLGAGIGSYGTDRYYILIEGASQSADDDRILDVKAQQTPTPYTFLGPGFQRRYDQWFPNDAARMITAYRALIANAENHLGWLDFDQQTFSVQERSPYKDDLPADELDSVTRYRKLATQWGIILATAHARADEDYAPQYVGHSVDNGITIAIDDQIATWQAQILTIAQDYSEQVKLDWESFTTTLAAPNSCSSPDK